MNSKKQCRCSICQLSKAFTAIAKKCNKGEVAALNDVWERMECAETELDLQNERATKRQDIVINKVRYTPK